MNKVDSVLISTIADWLINFSIFWIGVAIVAPVFPGFSSFSRVIVLTTDLLAGIVSLLIAYKLRKNL